MDSMTEPEIQARGDDASRLLSDPIMSAAIAATADRLQKAVMSTRIEDTIEREAAFAKYKGLGEVLVTLRKWEDAAAISRENHPQ